NVDAGMYVEALFRICTIKQFNFNCTYIRLPMQQGIPKNESYNYAPQALGFIGFYNFNDLSPSTIAAIARIIKTYQPPSFPDLASMQDLIAEVLNSSTQRFYTPLLLNTVPTDIQAFLQIQYNNLINTAQSTFVVILPYKLLKVRSVEITKEPNYIDEWVPNINKFISTVIKCNSAPDNTSKEAIISAEYGESANLSADAPEFVPQHNNPFTLPAVVDMNHYLKKTYSGFSDE
ncbi:MAG: hypothetical protein ACYCPT_03820, partial [Acidimicrobiales bacterium]